MDGERDSPFSFDLRLHGGQFSFAFREKEALALKNVQAQNSFMLLNKVQIYAQKRKRYLKHAKLFG